MSAKTRFSGPGRSIPLGWDGHEGASAGAPPVLPPARTRRRFTAVGAIVLLLGLIAAMVQLLDNPGPEDLARDYLQAMVVGDAATLRAHRAPSTDAGRVSDIALVDDVLTQADHRITDFTITNVGIHQGRAEVEATLHSTSGDAAVTLTLQSTDSGPFSPVTWQLQPVALPEIELAIPVDADEILLNGVPLDLSSVPEATRFSGHRLVLLSVLPGTYDIALPEQDERAESADVRVRVPQRLDQWRSAHTVVFYELTADGTRAAEESIREELRVCAQTATAAQPEECPFRVDPGVEGAVEATGQWQITRMPALYIEYTLGHGWVFSGMLGEATFTTTVTDPDTGEETEVVHTAEVELYAIAQPLEEEGFQIAMRDRACGFMIVYDAENGAAMDAPVHDCV